MNGIRQQPTTTTSKVLVTLTQGRKDLWNAHLGTYTSIVLDPVRDFILDPIFAISSIILPPIANSIPGGDIIISKIIQCNLFVMRLFYPPSRNNNNDREINLYQNAKNDLIINNKAGLVLPKFKPPSDTASAFRGTIALLVGMLADIVSVFMDRNKMTKWFNAMTEFKSYLDVSGVGNELQEAIYKPMWCGRLFDNLKILNDIQEEMYVDRCQKINKYKPEELTKPLQIGKRMMRFATAAYGTEMIRSALDREANPTELDNHTNAIAFHCDIAPEDIRIMCVDNSRDDMNVLHHFVAIDRETLTVVLALRGTLSLSGALVDMQGMDGDFCGCKAHKGMAEMADNIWAESGDKILQLFSKEPDLEDYAFVIVGHSLGAGAACLLNIKCHVENLLAGRPTKCYGFAPPPTFCSDELSKDSVEKSERIQKAINNTLCYVHDNDCVPFLSVSCIRRLATLMDTVDNRTEHMWAYQRFKIFWEWEKIPQEIIDDVKAVEARKRDSCVCINGASKLIIPCRMVIWMKKNFTGNKYEVYGCDPYDMADLNIFCGQDMISDHMVEPYEDALDELTTTTKAVAAS